MPRLDPLLFNPGVLAIYERFDAKHSPRKSHYMVLEHCNHSIPAWNANLNLGGTCVAWRHAPGRGIFTAHDVGLYLLCRKPC